MKVKYHNMLPISIISKTVENIAIDGEVPHLQVSAKYHAIQNIPSQCVFISLPASFSANS